MSVRTTTAASMATVLVRAPYATIIDGREICPDPEIDVVSSAAGGVSTTVARADETKVDAAVAAAKRAFPAWASISLPNSYNASTQGLALYQTSAA